MYIPCSWGAELNRQIVFCRAFVRAVCMSIMNSGPKSLGACFPFSFVASIKVFPFPFPRPPISYPAV